MQASSRMAWTAVLASAALCVSAVASPIIDGAVIKERIFNDASGSTFTSTNAYPASITMHDENVDSGNYANRHAFRLSANGGTSEAVFYNADNFSLFADVTITGSANVEGGLNLTPWWSQDVDGTFMLNTESGEVACFGGRLPFYSFTANDGITYTKGDTVRIGITYAANSLTMADPATIQYSYFDGATTTLSPVLAFDEGNPTEDPPYGLWGMLNNARVGGYFMPKVDTNNPGNYGDISFQNIQYIPEPGTLALLGLVGLIAARRRSA